MIRISHLRGLDSPAPMHVLHASKLFPPPFGGIETVLDELTRGLCQYDPAMKIDILATHSAALACREFADGRLRVDLLRSIGQIARTPIAPSYLSMLRRSEADLINFHFPYPWAELSYLFSGNPKPYVITYHSDIVKQKQLLKFWKPFMARFLAGASRIVVASPHIIENSPFLQGPLSKKTVVIPFGIDTESFIPTPDSRAAAALLRNQLAGSRPLLFFLGRLVYYKGLHVLLEAMRSLNAHLVIGGDGPLRTELEQIVRETGCSSKITFAGSIPPDQLRIYYQAADLFILPSTDTSEAFGMVMLEAHASGTPVVSSDLPTGVTFVNEHGKTGLCVSAGNPQSLAEGIQTLLSDSERRYRMGDYARTRACQNFDTRVMCKSYHQLYEGILSECKPHIQSQ